MMTAGELRDLAQRMFPGATVGTEVALAGDDILLTVQAGNLFFRHGFAPDGLREAPVRYMLDQAREVWRADLLMAHKALEALDAAP